MVNNLSNDPTTNLIVEVIGKELVNSWDLFDTLLTRFSLDTKAAIKIVDSNYPGLDFYNRRTRAQAELDREGSPYAIHDIYKKMVFSGLSKSHSVVLLAEELKVERYLMLPIRAIVEMVIPEDIIVSDMYLSDQNLADLIWDVCGLRMLKPAIRSNWGKATGTIWPEILRHYEIRSHAGDNIKFDVEIPRKFGIATIHIKNAHFSKWENKIFQLGHQHLALILRETRLRGVALKSNPIVDIVAGPYLTLLYAYSNWIHKFAGDKFTQFAFLRRDCEDLSRIFSTMYPSSEVKQIDLTRVITQINSPEFNDAILKQVNSDYLLLDMVATGRSFFKFINQAKCDISNFLVLIYLDKLLSPDEIRTTNESSNHDNFHCVTRSSEQIGHHYPLECLMQTTYPPVTSITYDSRSGGVVRGHSRLDLTKSEKKIINEKNELLQEFMRSIQRRHFVSCETSDAFALIQHSLCEILASKEILESFPSFLTRERKLNFREARSDQPLNPS